MKKQPSKPTAARRTAKPKASGVTKSTPLRRKTAPDLGQRTLRAKAVLDAKPGAVAQPMSARAGAQPLVLIYKIMGKMFAILSVRGTENVILKCDPHLAEILRGQYEGVGHRSHLDRRFWISVSLDADVPAREIDKLIAQSYELVRAGLTRKQQAELAALSA